MVTTSGAPTLRAIHSEDEPFLLAVYASTREEELRAVPWTEAEKEAFLRFQYAAQRAHYRQHFPDASYDLILVGDRPVGRLYVHRSADEIRLIDIALLTTERGRGVGSALLQTLLAESRAIRRPLRIHVEKENPAMRLYTRLGFVPIADRGVYLFLEWTPSDDGVEDAREPDR